MVVSKKSQFVPFKEKKINQNISRSREFKKHTFLVSYMKREM